MDSGLKGKTAIITGASGGIGRAIARSFSHEGAKLAIHYHRNEASAEELAKDLATETKTIGADLREESAVKNLIATTTSDLGVPEILIANAGVWPIEDTPIHEMSLERWNDTLNTDLTSVFLCVREFLQAAKKANLESPAIVLIGSTAGRFGEAGHADYAAAKSAFMNGMMNSLKNEISKLTPRGRINTVCPGWTLTEMARDFTTNKDAMTRALQTIAMRKFASADDIASAVTFMASNKLAGHITGQSLYVTGGMEGRILHGPNEVNVEEAIQGF